MNIINSVAHDEMNIPSSDIVKNRIEIITKYAFFILLVLFIVF